MNEKELKIVYGTILFGGFLAAATLGPNALAKLNEGQSDPQKVVNIVGYVSGLLALTAVAGLVIDTRQELEILRNL